jgi:lactoylglutathione lyase
MKNIFIPIITLLVGILIGKFIFDKANPQLNNADQSKNIDTTPTLGAFSLSLSVKDLQKSDSFYRNLGFEKIGGSYKNNYLILKNGDAIIGIFNGMFEGNMLTFNPGWNQHAKNLYTFIDIRSIQQQLLEKGIVSEPIIDPNSQGPASTMLKDPDGNLILLDQHR